MKVTSQGRGHQTQISALWATLPSFADPETAAASSDIPTIPINDLALESATVDRSSSSFSQAPNYVKAACGLAFGLMMTSGPLFPNLIARLPRRVPKWIVVLRTRTERADFRGAGRFSPARLSGWLRAWMLWR